MPFFRKSFTVTVYKTILVSTLIWASYAIGRTALFPLENLVLDRHEDNQQTNALKPYSQRQMMKNENHNSCFSSEQWCQYFELYIDLNTLNPTSCPKSTDWCPPPPVCNSTNVACTRPGDYCRGEYNCKKNDNFPFCCQNCQNLVVSCCPNWCSSCLNWETRCDLYRYFETQDSSAYEPQRKFKQYTESLCIPLELMFLCGDKSAATLFCKGYVSDSIKDNGDTSDCVKSCVSVVTDKKYCSCYDGH